MYPPPLAAIFLRCGLSASVITSLLAALLALGLPAGHTWAQNAETIDPPFALCAAADNIGSISLPHEIDGSLEDDDPSARVDFYRVEAEPGLALVADMTDQQTEPSTMRNPLLGLFDAACNRLAYNDDLIEPGLSSLDARLTFPVPDSGVFILAAAASPDTDFDGSSDDIGTYTLHIDRAAPLPPPPSIVEPPVARIERAADGRIDVFLDGVSGASGYNIYRDSRYLLTVRPPPFAQRFRFDGVAGDYCLVAFVEIGDLPRYSRCSELIRIEHDSLVERRPPAPRELRAAIYAPGFVELFWRPGVNDGRIVAYRIRRDGVEIDTGDQQSYIERGLEPGRTYRYSVTAIDYEGFESAPAYLDVRPTAIGVVPPVSEDGVAPSPPGSIRGRTYSPGVVEIFWERSIDHNGLAGYAVSRDGERVDFTKGVSHFEPRLQHRASHLWSVVAVGANGARSTPQRLRLEGDTFTALQDTHSNAMITRESHVELLAHAFELYVGDPYSSPLHALTSAELSLSDIRVSQDTSGNPILNEYDCGDGRAMLALLYSGTNFGEIYDWTFEDCLFDGQLYDGAVNVHENARGPTFSSAGLSVRAAAGLGTTFSGMAQWWTSQTAFFDQIRSWDTELFSIDARTSDGDLTLQNSSTRFAYGYQGNDRFVASLEGSFAVRSDATGGALLNASTPQAFSYIREPDETVNPGNAWDFTSGQLELIAEDGSRVLLDADTGDSATVRLTIDNERGPDTFMASWTTWQNRLRFARYPLDAPERIERLAARPTALPGPAITPENYISLLDHVVALYAGSGYAQPLTLAHTFALEDWTAMRTARGIRTDHVDCEGGGTATIQLADDEPITELQPFRLRFDSCESEGFQLDGEARSQKLRAISGSWDLESNALTWLDGSGEQMQFRGRVARDETADNSSVADTVCAWRTEGMNLSGLVGDPEAILLTSARRDYRIETESGIELITLDTPGTHFETRVADAELLFQGGLDVVSTASGGHALHIVAAALLIRSEELSTGNEVGLLSGGLLIEAEDGSRLSLGDFTESAQASIVITNSDGRFEITSPWVSRSLTANRADDSACAFH